MEKAAPAPDDTADSTGLTLLKTRRAFIGAIAATTLAVLGGTLGNIASFNWTKTEDLRNSIDYFFFLFDSERYPEAYQVGLEDILRHSARDSEEFARWLNNVACAAVWDGQFNDALNLFHQIPSIQETWWKPVAVANLAYTRYHLGLDTRRYISYLERSITSLARARHSKQDAWLQLWSRQPSGSDQLVVPPLAVLYRLYAKEGDLSESFQAAQADIQLQGVTAQGARLVVGLMAAAVGQEKEALRLADQVAREHNPPSSWDHMEALRDLIVACLTGRGGVAGTAFIGQANSVKGEYYSWTSLADVRYFLSADSTTSLRHEFGERILLSYKAADMGNLSAMLQLGGLLKS